MYAPARFLKFAQQNLIKTVTDDVIKEVDEVSRTTMIGVSSGTQGQSKPVDFLFSNLLNRLHGRFAQVMPKQSNQMIYCMNNAVRHVFNLFYVGYRSPTFNAIGEIFAAADRELRDQSLNEITLALVVSNKEVADHLIRKIGSAHNYSISDRVYALIIIFNENKKIEVEYLEEIRFNDVCRNSRGLTD